MVKIAEMEENRPKKVTKYKRKLINYVTEKEQKQKNGSLNA